MHSLDKASWALGDKPPLRAWEWEVGRPAGPGFGDQFDHQAVVFEYDDGVRVYGFTRDQEDCYSRYLGRDSRAPRDGAMFSSTGSRARRTGPTRDRGEHVRCRAPGAFEAIRSGKPVNNGNYMSVSSALGIMAKIACYYRQHGHLGRVDAVEAVVALPKYDWNVEAPVKPGPDGTVRDGHARAAELQAWLIESEGGEDI